jgi:hypothetical protein
MPGTREQIQEERRRLRAEYGELFDAVSALLFRHDPAGINFEVNPEEYNSEAGTILPRLKSCHGVDEVRAVVHEEFVRWFGLSIAGGPERYQQIASEIWRLWLLPKAPRPSAGEGNA